MKKKKKKVLMPRLPMETVKLLRTKGGPQSTKKGDKGYNRKVEKAKERRDYNKI